MSILDSAYQIGEQMKTISIGREWNELYSRLSESISQEAWDTYLKTSSRGLMHYYSFPHAREVIEDNSKRNDLPKILQDQLQELIATEPLKRLCELSITLGNSLEKMIISCMAPRHIPKDFGQLRASAKLSRSIKDMHRAFQRSGILKSSLRYMDPKTNQFPDVVLAFNKEKNLVHPMDRRIRKIVRKLGSTEQQQKLLSVMYISDLVLEITRQMVFESHLKLVANISSESIVRSAVKNVKGIRPVCLSLDARMLSQMNGTGHFMTVPLAGVKQTAIITRRRVQFGQDVPSGFKMTMNGYLYFESDVDLLNQLIE